MRIVAFSDSHSMRSRLYSIVERHRKNCDLFVFLGDVDRDFDDVIKLYPDIKYKRVAGNNEFYSENNFDEIFEFNGKKVFITHGHKYMVKHGYDNIINHAKTIGCNICLFGHTHKQYSNYKNGLYIINPGAAMLGEYAIIDVTDNGIMPILRRY